jgi:ABC-type antimicrobial peptide transport system permease subunit
VPSITRALGQVEAGVPAIYIRTMEKDLAGLSWTVRTLTALLVTFAAGSLLIAALGQYAAMSFAMRRRVRDFGIRIAMGASPRQILASALAEGLRLTVAGLCIGAVLGFMSGRAGRGLLYGVTPNDAATYAAVMAVLGAASLAACYVPARRAARLDPLRALREE